MNSYGNITAKIEEKSVQDTMINKKFLAYNDSNENSDAFLREPQFEALEMYVLVKEFMDNAHMYQMFDEWRKENIDFQMRRIILFTKAVRGHF